MQTRNKRALLQHCGRSSRAPRGRRSAKKPPDSKRALLGCARKKYTRENHVERTPTAGGRATRQSRTATECVLGWLPPSHGVLGHRVHLAACQTFMMQRASATATWYNPRDDRPTPCHPPHDHDHPGKIDEQSRGHAPAASPRPNQRPRTADVRTDTVTP